MQIQIFKQNNVDVVSSRTVAEELGKRHDHIIRDIDSKIKDNPTLGYAHYFIESYYQVNGRNYREYLLTKDGFILLVFNYNGHDQFKMAYIQEFNRLSSLAQQNGYTLPGNFKEALLMLAESVDINEQLHAKITKDEPFVNFGKAVLASDDAISFGSFSKLLYDKERLTIGRNKLFEWFRNRGYLINHGREYNIPKQQYINQGLFKIKESIQHTPEGDRITRTPLITGKGQIYFTKILMENYSENFN